MIINDKQSKSTLIVSVRTYKSHLTRTQKGTALKVSAIPNIISEQNRLLNAGPIVFRQFRLYLRLNIVSKVREEVNACTTFKFVNANR